MILLSLLYSPRCNKYLRIQQQQYDCCAPSRYILVSRYLSHLAQQRSKLLRFSSFGRSLHPREVPSPPSRCRPPPLPTAIVLLLMKAGIGARLKAQRAGAPAKRTGQDGPARVPYTREKATAVGCVLRFSGMPLASL